MVIQNQRGIKDYTVGIYARVRTIHKAQMYSLDAQSSVLTRISAEHRTWFVADIFINLEFAKTGTTKSEFNRMISEFERWDLDIILTKSLSRFGRDAKDGLEAIGKIRSAGKMIAFDKDKIHIETIKDELLISIIEACNQAEN